MDEGRRKGVDWRPVKVSGLSKERQKEYDEYQAALDETKVLAKKLKDGLRKEWDRSFPHGRNDDGKVCSFTITGGRLQYAWTDKAKTKSKGTDEGDDVFSHP